jgi:hypothetical protein
MKRDMELVRSIMLEIESVPAGRDWQWHEGDLTGPHTDVEVMKHLYMMEKAGFISGNGNTGRYRLTWHGHEFLGAMRDPLIWEAVREKFLGEGVSSAYSIMMDYANSLIMKRFLAK